MYTYIMGRVPIILVLLNSSDLPTNQQTKQEFMKEKETQKKRGLILLLVASLVLPLSFP